MNFQRFLVLVVPVTLGTLEGFAGVSRSVPSNTSRHSRGIENHVTIGTFNTCWSTIDVFRAGSDGGARQGIVQTGWTQAWNVEG